MNEQLLLISIIFIPLAGALFLPLIGRISVKLRNILAFVLVFSSFLLSSYIIPNIFSGHKINIQMSLPLGFNFAFTADGLAVFMAAVSSFISAIIVLYSFSYISHYQNQSEYYFMVVLFLGSMMGLVFSGNLILMYIFWEITALTSWRLIGFFRGKEYVMRADKAFLITAFGALIMLLGFIRLYQEIGSFDLAVIREAVRNSSVSWQTVALILVGILSKSATLPFHVWLPDAGVAPSPVTALLHAAVLVKIGVYAFARIFVFTVPLNLPWQMIVSVIAGFSMLVSAGAALLDTDIKRIIAYSTISQIGFIFLGFALGSKIGIAGSILYILMHGLAKAGLFLCAGIVEQNTKTKDITKLGGLFYAMPFTAISFLFCAFSVMGVPVFGGFFSKYMIISAALESGHIWLAVTFILGAVLTILYLFRVFNSVFLGETKIYSSSVKEGSSLMVACVVLFAFLSLAGGVFIYYPAQIARLIALTAAG